jgi:hypothetical protein
MRLEKISALVAAATALLFVMSALWWLDYLSTLGHRELLNVITFSDVVNDAIGRIWVIPVGLLFVVPPFLDERPFVDSKGHPARFHPQLLLWALPVMMPIWATALLWGKPKNYTMMLAVTGAFGVAALIYPFYIKHRIPRSLQGSILPAAILGLYLPFAFGAISAVRDLTDSKRTYYMIDSSSGRVDAPVVVYFDRGIAAIWGEHVRLIPWANIKSVQSVDVVLSKSRAKP